MKWQFVVSSMIAGVGIGVILGAPLNILATEGLKSDKGTALASLSLLRQMASGSGSFDSTQMNEIVSSIQDPALKEVILNSVSEII